MHCARKIKITSVNCERKGKESSYKMPKGIAVGGGVGTKGGRERLVNFSTKELNLDFR